MTLTWEQLMEHYPRLPDTNAGDDIMDVLDAELTQPQKDALVAQLEPLIQATIEEEITATEATIRRLAGKLPEDNPLRLAIDNTP